MYSNTKPCIEDKKAKKNQREREQCDILRFLFFVGEHQVGLGTFPQPGQVFRGGHVVPCDLGLHQQARVDLELVAAPLRVCRTLHLVAGHHVVAAVEEHLLVLTIMLFVVLLNICLIIV